MPKTKVEVYDKDQLIYPFIENDHVSFSNGMKVSEMLDQSISMPTVTHENLSFKVGVGDQDVSSAIVDSSVSEMTIKGKTYQNILPEPSTHVLTNNKEMFKVNEGLDPNVEIVDGVSKSAILSGQTLVNLAKNLSDEISSSKNSTSYISSDILVKNNTSYIVIAKVKSSNSLSSVTSHAFLRIESMPSCTVLNGITGDITTEYTTKSFIFNTGNETKVKFNLRNAYSGWGLTENTSYVKEIMIIEYQDGMENWDIPYFEGMQSVKMPVLTTVGKNLINLGDFSEQTKNGITLSRNNNSSIKLNGGTSSMTNFWFNNLSIKLKPDTYQFLLNHQDSNITYFFRDADGNNVIATKFSNSVVITEDKTITTLLIQVNGGVSSSNQDINIQLERSSVATSYEPYKTNTLSTPEEVVLRSLPNGVKDELNLLTGEYIQRVGEIVFDGSSDEGWKLAASHTGGSTRMETECISGLFVGVETSNDTPNMKCDQYDEFNFNALYGGKREGIGFYRNTHIIVHDSKYTNINSFLARLQQNPITVQYELAEPIVKTVDVSSSGNWEKVVLDGSENWQCDANNGTGAQVYIPRHQGQKFFNSLKSQDGGGLLHDLKNANYFKVFSIGNNYGMTVVIDKANFPISIDTNITLGEVRELWKQWLSQNPITVWYQTATHQDSTQVKQPIFFKDGHIIQSSGVDNSLIPTLDYQAKTSNSYVMDLIKTNTRYTMKAKTASGTFTIDGTSYNIGTNTAFTSPSLMTNKFLVMSNKTNEEVMILEGDVVSKTIPYFKGIKSAFEDEGKIEVLSQGKNLFDVNEVQTNDRTRGVWETRIEENKIYSTRVTSQVSSGEFGAFIQIPVKPSVEYVYKFDFTSTDPNLEDPQVYIYNNSSIWGEVLSSNSGKTTKFTTKTNTQFITIGLNYRSGVQKGTEFCTYNAILIETTQTRDYEPYKSNSTKIPLLLPLRSLPNGVCDEIILDRENNKAKVIRRVGKIAVVAPQVSKWYTDNNGVANVSRIRLEINSLGAKKGQKQLINNLVPVTGRGFSFDEETTYMDDAQNYWLWLHVSNSRLPAPTIEGFKSWLSQNQLVTYYELETPIITEVDLEGFPYIYKDGHIFLNSEIAPTMKITYSINQCQQISASNEDIIRHEKELTYLQKLIAQYVQVNYESVLLSLKV